MVPNITPILQRLTGEWAALLQPDAILAVCGEVGYTGWRDRVLTPVTTMQLFLLQVLHVTPRAAICPIGRAYGSRRQHTVKRVPDSRCASLISSSSVSAAPCSDPLWMKGGGMVIARFWSIARAAPCPIRLPSRTRSANRQSSDQGAASKRGPRTFSSSV